MTSKVLRFTLGATIGVLVLVGVAASATFYLRPAYNPGFLTYPAVVALHVVLGAVYLALAPFQFLRRVRERHLSYHRWVGRLLVAVGLVVGVTGLFMGVVIPFAGWIERGYTSFFGLLFAISLAKGFSDARSGRLAAHRAWMIRAFALGLAIATQRLIVFPVLFVLTEPTEVQLQALSVGSFLTAFTLHALAAEVWLRRSRRGIKAKVA